MGKVKDEAPTGKAVKPATRASSGWNFGGLGAFIANLFRGEIYKPAQGWYARLWTAIGLGILVLAGVWRLYVTRLDDPDRYSAPARFGIPAALGAVLAWIVYRIVQFPPFVDFLIATEAEMNKVSWTTKEELKRATIVVLATVVLLALYLLGVDLVWQFLLKAVGVLRTDDTSAFGSQVG